MAKSQNPVAKLYQTVIEDVINNVREFFLDEGVDEQVLQELKQIWENKLDQSKAVDSPSMGERSGRPQMYTYITQPGAQQQGVGQQVVYQTIPAPAVLSGASQQARVALPDGMVYQRKSANLVLPHQQIYAAYQPVTVLQQPGTQVAQQPRPVPNPGQTLVLTSANQAAIGQQQTSTGKQQPSAIIQVDGADDSEEGPSTSGLSTQACQSKKGELFRKVKPKKRVSVILQFDGGNDSSSDDDDDDDEDEDEDDEDEDDDDGTQEEEQPEQDEDPLCTDDDDSDQDANELFDTDNVVVCQYDKIHRCKAKWKFNLKVGIMNLKGKDHVFQKAVGEAEW